MPDLSTVNEAYAKAEQAKQDWMHNIRNNLIKANDENVLNIRPGTYLAYIDSVHNWAQLYAKYYGWTGV